MSSTTFSVRVELGIKKRLEKLAKSTGAHVHFSPPKHLTDTSTSTSGRSPALSRRWTRSIEAKCGFLTTRSKTGSVLGPKARVAGSPSGRGVSEYRLVARGDPRPDFIEKLYSGGKPRRRAQRIALRILHSVEHVLPNSPHTGLRRTRAGHAGTCCAPDVLHCSLSGRWREFAHFARIS